MTQDPPGIIDAEAADRESEPLVSCVIPNYNGAAWVGEAVESCLAQTYPRKEVVVVDDGSRDQSLHVLKGFAGRIRIVTQDNRGVSVARNVGIHYSQGSLIAFCDADDRWRADKLERQVALLRIQPQAAACYTDFECFGDAPDAATAGFRNWRQQTRSSDQPLALANRMVISSVMARRWALIRAGGFRAGVFYPADWLMWTALEHIGEFLFLDEPLTCYRLHTGGTTVRMTVPHRLELLAAAIFHRLVAAASGGRRQPIAPQALVDKLDEEFGWVLSELPTADGPAAAAGLLVRRLAAGFRPSFYARCFPLIVRQYIGRHWQRRRA